MICYGVNRIIMDIWVFFIGFLDLGGINRCVMLEEVWEKKFCVLVNVIVIGYIFIVCFVGNDIDDDN